MGKSGFAVFIGLLLVAASVFIPSTSVFAQYSGCDYCAGQAGNYCYLQHCTNPNPPPTYLSDCSASCVYRDQCGGNKACVWSQDNPGQGGYDCNNWCPWSACIYDGNGWFQTRTCCGTPADELQVQACTPEGGGGGGGGGGAPSCTIDLSPASSTYAVGNSNTFTASVVPSNGTVDQVNFFSENTAIATVNPATDTTPVYSTQATGVAEGAANIISTALMEGAPLCTDVSTVNIVSAGPWWQAKDLDILSGGSVSSRIPSTCIAPCSPHLILDGDGGYPGVATYSPSLNVGSGGISSTGWNANTTLSQKRQYKYALFERIVPTNIVFNEITAAEAPGGVLAGDTLEVLGTSSEGYYWYMYDAETLGDLTIGSSPANFGSRKAILYVKGGNLNIERRIKYTDGTGFFMAIVGKDSSGAGGNINISSNVGGTIADLEGMYVADGTISTGTAGVDSDSPLTIRGSLAAYGGVNLQRDLPDDTTEPAEYVEFGADLLLNYPKELRVKSYRWEEVAP